jgi:hypothetical protein
MSSVLSFLHRGVRAAVPAAQAAQVRDSELKRSELVSLWPGTMPQEQRQLCVRSELGPIWLACADLDLCELEAAAMLPLSELLRGLLRELPHVVGLATLQGKVVWLVDVCRLPSRAKVE